MIQNFQKFFPIANCDPGNDVTAMRCENFQPWKPLREERSIIFAKQTIRDITGR